MNNNSNEDDNNNAENIGENIGNLRGVRINPQMIKSPDNMANRVKRAAAFRKLSSGRSTGDKLVMSTMYPSMYNVSHSSNKDAKLPLLEMMTSKIIPLPKKEFADGFKIEILEIKGRDRKFQDLVVISNEYGVKAKNGLDKLVANELKANNPPEFPPFVPKFRKEKKRSLKEALRNKETRRNIDKERIRYDKRMARENPSPGVRSVDFKIRVSQGDKVSGVSFTVYRGGSLRASGGILNVSISSRQGMDSALESIGKQIQRVHQFLIENFNVPNKTLEINNLVTGFEVNMPINIDRATRYMYDKKGGKSMFSSKNVIKKTGMVKKESLKKKPRVAGGVGVIPMNDFTLRISMSGKCQIEGADDPDALWKFYSRDVFNLMNEFTKQGFTGPYKAMPNRNIRPNSKTKTERRIVNKPAPYTTRRGTSCPPGKRPDPYSFQGKCPRGYYVRPNPQGQPCCYKIPKNIRYSKAKVAAAYKNADVKIPKSVEAIFLIKGSNNKKNNTSTSNVRNFIKTSNDPKLTNEMLTRMNRRLDAYKSKRMKNGGYVIRTLRGNKFENRPIPEREFIDKFGPRWWIQVNDFKIDTRQCMRYSKVALLDIAARMGLTDVKSTMPKDEICHIIRKAVRGTNVNKTSVRSTGVSVMDGNKERFIHGTRIGSRECSSFPRKKLEEFAEQFGISANKSMRGPDLCKRIFEKVEIKRGKMASNERNRLANQTKKRNNATTTGVKTKKKTKEVVSGNKANVLNNAGLSAKKFYKSMDEILGLNKLFINKSELKDLAREAGRMANSNKNTNLMNTADVKKLKTFITTSIKEKARPIIVRGAVSQVIDIDELKNGFMNAVVKEATDKKMSRSAAISYAKKLKKNYVK